MIDCSPRRLREYDEEAEEKLDIGVLAEAEKIRRAALKARVEEPSPAYPAVYQGVPSGKFISPFVVVEGHPDNIVPVGEQIKLRAYYSAYCPGQPWYAPAWTVSVKAKGDGIAVKNDIGVLIEGPVTGSTYLNAPGWPIMPNKSVTLEVTLWGNPDAGQKLPL